MDGWVLVLGGGKWQVDIIRSAQRLGLRTVVTDISADAPGRSVADRFVQIDTNDRVGLAAIAKEHRVRFVLAEQTDRVVPVAASINEQLGFPGIRPDVAERFTNKKAMRDGLVRADVPMPRYAEVGSADEAADRARSFGYPVVLKPKDSQSSMGVFQVLDEAGLRMRWPESVKVSRDGTLLVEEFVDGTEITVEGFALDGRFTPLAISEKGHYPSNPCVARLLAYPPRFPAPVLDRIRATARRVVETLGLQDGISHAEYRVRDGVPYLVEVAARGGGNRIASGIVPHVSSVNVYELLVRKLAGEPVAMPAPTSRAAILQFFSFPPGKVVAVRGREEAQAIAWELSLPFDAGTEVIRTSDDRNRPGYFIVLGEDRDEVDAKAARIEQLVRVEYA